MSIWLIEFARKESDCWHVSGDSTPEEEYDDARCMAKILSEDSVGYKYRAAEYVRKEQEMK